MPSVRARKHEVEQMEAELAEQRTKVAALEAQLQALRTTDSLTGLPLPAVLHQRLLVEIERSRRHGAPLTLAVVDVDGFRAINSHHGHEVGDRVLVAVGHALTASTRTTDLVTRSGGDELVVMLPETRDEEALQAFDRIFRALESLVVDGLESVSASVGIAQWERGWTADQLIGAAGTRVDVARSLGGGRAAAADLVERTADGDQPGAKSDVITALAEALTERDRYTGEHSESVVDLVEAVARALSLSASEVEHIRAAALLHDIGKVAIPDEILNKPGPLDDAEWKVMREHPVVGERILRAIPGMGPIARIVRHEHESFDGSGYPDGLVGDQIPIGARIILACDAYHAMTSDRPYRKAMDYREAIRELSTCAGKQFDPQVTERLIGTLYGQRQGGGGRTDAEVAASA
jgi:diguanylate cyclase (GGDEF)-like protein/putative nucleotidyltransferase with HDIG domain